MKVLKNNYNYVFNTEAKTPIKKVAPYPRKTTCGYCMSELEYDKSDIHIGEYGIMKFECPVCGEGVFLDDHEDNIILTVDNIEFPTHFYHVSKETGAVDICERDFKKYLREAIKYLRENKDEYCYGEHITGNLYLHVCKYYGDEMYDVTISNDFYSMNIPFEKEDY